MLIRDLMQTEVATLRVDDTLDLASDIMELDASGTCRCSRPAWWSAWSRSAISTAPPCRRCSSSAGARNATGWRTFRCAP